MRVLELGLGALRGLDFRQAAVSHMRQLVDRFGESCDLGVFDRGEVLYLEVMLSEQVVVIVSRVGGHLPIHCTATGKVLLAFLPPEVVDPVLSAPLEAHTKNTIVSPEKLREELAVIRRRGYGVDDEEFSAGVRAVAAPIRDLDGRIVAAIGMAGPTNRMTPGRVEEIVQAIMEAAEAVSAHFLQQMPSVADPYLASGE
jgi:DNA-binding IclR family transcriptional regulator